MEGLVLAGLVLAGMVNKNNSITNELESNPVAPSMDNIYQSTHLNDVKQTEKELVDKNINDINNINNLNNSNDN